MSNTIYMLGAGVNQEIKDFDGLSPPLIDNFFQLALRKKKYCNEHYTSRVQIVYDYIEKYWKRDRSALASATFDLEECFTMLELQLREAINTNDMKKIRRLYTTQFRLKSFIAEVLSEFETFASVSDVMRLFGDVLYKEKPFILTFNYDCFIEAAIESASKVNPSVPQEMLNRSPLEETEVSDDELAYSHFNWNRPLGYGVKFDVVQLMRAGISTYVEGKNFYSHAKNNLYSWPILKLHGSLNWFRYLPIRKYPVFPNEPEVSLPEEKEKEVILIKARWWSSEPPDLKGWYIDPLIITPTLHKEEILHDPVYNRIFDPIWKKAKSVLSKCAKLVVIGYSFPSTDFLTRKLLLETFSEHAIERLAVVNPDPSVVQKVKDLCHFERPATVCKNLQEFLHWVEV